MQIILRSQLKRVETGKNPTTGVIEFHTKGKYNGSPKIPRAATHFLSHRDQLNAIYRAQLIFKYSKENSIPPISMKKIIGEGYRREGLKYEQTTKAIVHLDKNGSPITAYTEK